MAAAPPSDQLGALQWLAPPLLHVYPAPAQSFPDPKTAQSFPACILVVQTHACSKMYFSNTVYLVVVARRHSFIAANFQELFVHVLYSKHLSKTTTSVLVSVRELKA